MLLHTQHLGRYCKKSKEALNYFLALKTHRVVRRVRSGTRTIEGRPRAPTACTMDYSERFSSPQRSFSCAKFCMFTGTLSWGEHPLFFGVFF